MNDKPTLRHYVYFSLIILGLFCLEPVVMFLADHFYIVLGGVIVGSLLSLIDYFLNDTQRNSPEARRKANRGR